MTSRLVTGTLISCGTGFSLLDHLNLAFLGDAASLNRWEF